jgi:hypothetical protein
LLREDVKNKVHTTMQPSELQASREEYKSFKPEKFKHRIYQEVRRSKWLYYLNLKRAKLRACGPQTAQTTSDFNNIYI